MKYTCHNCNNVFDGDDFTIDCPKCESQNIALFSGKEEADQPTYDTDKTVHVSAVPPKADSDQTQFIRPEDFKQPKEDAPTVNIQRDKASPPEPKMAPVPPKETPAQAASTQRPHQEKPASPAPPPKKKSPTMLIVLAVVIIGLIGGVLWWQNQEDSAEKEEPINQEFADIEARVRVEERDQAYFIVGSIIDGGTETAIEPNRIEALYRANDEREFSFDQATGQIFFCPEMEGLTAFKVVLADYSGPEAITAAVDLSLKGKAPAKGANCTHKLEARYINVAFTPNCQMIISITDPYDYGDEVFSVSVTGKQGPFEKGQLKWDVKPFGGKTVDVWIQQGEMSPIAYPQNGTRVIPKCVESAKETESLAVQLGSAAQRFGQNPRDRSASQELQELSMNSLPESPKFFVDGEEFEGFSALSTKLRIDNMNEGKTFELVSKPTIVNNRYWKIEYRSK